MGAIGDLNNISEIRIISESLADMFRYNIKGSHVVFLEDELKQVKNYITIQTFRFADSFKIKYQILPDLLHCRIVKFLIQPVIENAIYHGLEPRGEGGVLILQVSEKENNLLIYVKDNGVGIPKKRLKELHDKLEHTQENVLFGIENRSIGILNCHYRIQHYYGKQYGLSINSTEGKGTEVMMIIPKIEG